MQYRLLADLLLSLHLGFVVFAVLGGLLVLRWPAVVWLHLPAASWAAGIEFGGWPCPLTAWENRLRMLGGEAGYSGGFIEHYIVALLYPAGLTREMQVALGVAVVVINVVIYRRVLRNRLNSKTDGSGAARTRRAQ